MRTMTQALTSRDQPGAVFQALEAVVAETIGVRLFTLMQIDFERQIAWRNYSNMPDVYPISGEKPIQNNAWTVQVQERQETFVANSIEEIAAVFPDHDLIQSLGCESCINIPVVICGQVIGTLNCLHTAGHYTPKRVINSETLKAPGALAFLMAARMETKR